MRFKRAGALILSLLIFAVCCTACKPDNIAPPAEILDPAAQSAVSVPEQTPAENNAIPALEETEQAQPETESETPEEQPAEVSEETQAPEESKKNEPSSASGEEEAETPPFAPATLIDNPLEQPDFRPSAEKENVLPISGWI